MLTAAVAVHTKFIFRHNFATVVDGRLYRSSQPRGDDWNILSRWGIATVVNLRTREESPASLVREKRICAEAGVRMVHIPIAAELPSPQQVDEFLRLAESSSGPILIHCKHGEDRSGVMVAAFRVSAQGWSIRRAVREMFRYRARPDAGKLERIEAILEKLR